MGVKFKYIKVLVYQVYQVVLFKSTVLLCNKVPMSKTTDRLANIVNNIVASQIPGCQVKVSTYLEVLFFVTLTKLK